jgi:hypothetical protein
MTKAYVNPRQGRNITQPLKTPKKKKKSNPELTGHLLGVNPRYSLTLANISGLAPEARKEHLGEILRFFGQPEEHWLALSRLRLTTAS